MSRPDPIRVLVLSVVKHDYVARGVASHPGFELVVVADDANQPDWVHESETMSSPGSTAFPTFAMSKGPSPSTMSRWRWFPPRPSAIAT